LRKKAPNSLRGQPLHSALIDKKIGFSMTERDIFIAALQIEDPIQRRAFLDDACAQQPELRARVEELLRLNQGASGFLEKPAVNPPTPGALQGTFDHPASTEQHGAVIGPYKLLERIGEGGMGAVWMAQQSEPVKRLVALKLIKAGMDSKHVVARFEQERQALALMDHPNIARVLDVGATNAGRPYFVMDLVKGAPITRYCDEHRLTPRERLELFLPVCQAVQHAHQKGVIHRDLKPSNVLVALYDGRPVPKVIDFGVAKATETPLTDKTLVTGFGAIVGTLEYMSPEQAEINQLDIDTRSDVYSLGVLLYELLTGAPPFSRKELEKGGMLEMLRTIREQEPSKPSTKLSSAESLPTLAANRGTEPAKLTKLVKGDLDWIVMKALEKDRNRRYETANGFAMDVQRYLADEAVQACPPSAGYKLRKFARRNRAMVSSAVTILILLAAGVAGTSFGLVRAERRRVQAEDAEAETLASYRENTDDAIDQLIGSKPQLGPQERQYLERALKRWQAFAERQGDDERSRAIRAEGHFRMAYLWHRLGRREDARREYETARDLRQKLAAASSNVQYQEDLANLLNGLGGLLVDMGEREAARLEYESALGIHEKLAAEFQGVPKYQEEWGVTQNSRGLLRSGLGQFEAARKDFEAARDRQQKLVAAYPDAFGYQQQLARTHNNLANALAEMNERDAARVEYERGRNLLQKLVAESPDVPHYQEELATVQNSLAIMFAALGQQDAARKEYEGARDRQQKLAADFPSIPQYRQQLAKIYYGLAIVNMETGRFPAAQKDYETSRDLRKKLSETYPAASEYQYDLANSYNGLAILFATLEQFEASRGAFEMARDQLKKVVAAHPMVPSYLQELAGAHNNLGKVLGLQGKREAALRELEAAQELQQKLVDALPNVPQYRMQLAASGNNIGVLIRDGGLPGESLKWFDLAIRTQTPIYEQDRRQVIVQQYLRNAYFNRAQAFDKLKKHAEALQDWDKAVELSSAAEQPESRAGRATSRLHAGQTAQAIADVVELTKASNWPAEQWCDFACFYAVASSKVADQKAAYANRAMELLSKAATAGYKDAARVATDTDLESLRQRDDFKKLLAEMKAGKGKSPDSKK